MTGTRGILADAHFYGLIDFETAVAQLRRTSDPSDDGQIVFEEEVGERMSSCLATKEMQTAVAIVCHFLPEGQKS